MFYPDRVETGPYFVPGLPHVVAHSRRRRTMPAKDPADAPTVRVHFVHEGGGGWISTASKTGGVFLEPLAARPPDQTASRSFVARTLNPTGQARVTLSPRYEQLRAARGPRQEEKGPEIRPKRCS